MPKLKYPAKSHPGRAGRKASPLPSFWKRLRASEDERKEFMDMLTGDAENDFIILYHLLLQWQGRGRAWVYPAEWQKKP